MTLEQRRQMIEAQRATALTNVKLAETALRAAENEFNRIDDELDRITELEWQETERRLRRAS